MERKLYYYTFFTSIILIFLGAIGMFYESKEYVILLLIGLSGLFDSLSEAHSKFKKYFRLFSIVLFPLIIYYAIIFWKKTYLIILSIFLIVALLIITIKRYRKH